MSLHLPGRSWEAQEPFLSFGQMVRGFLWLLEVDKDEREKNLYHPMAWPTAPPPLGLPLQSWRDPRVHVQRKA